MDAYNAERARLITEDRALRVDSHLSACTLGPMADKADEIVRRIRAEEAETVWSENNEIPTSPGQDIEHMFPGMGFLVSRDIIMSTKLFNILTKMPKGALLHAHLDGMVNVKTLLGLAYKQPALHVKAPASLTEDTLSESLPEFLALTPDGMAFVTSSSLCHASYSGDWVPLATARANFDANLGGPEGFDKWVIGALTINPTEAYKTHSTVAKIWRKFQSTFQVSAGLIRFAPIWRQYIREFLLSSVADGISYVEARINFLFKFMIGADGQENIPHRQWITEFDAVVAGVKQELKEQGREDEFFGARIIYTTIRVVTPEEMEWYCNDCIELKREFPHLIAGFDLVGDENVLKPLVDYMPQLLAFQARVKELQLDLPFIFHAGETLGDGSKADMNLYDAILLGTKRIGHGFSLIKHPKLMQICRERNIAVECCPISNEILRLTSSMSMHPFPAMLNHGVPIALCSDDPAIFGNLGLSFDFFQVLVASDVTGLLTLGELARKSLEYTTLEPSEKEAAIALWEKRWMKFLEDVASEQF